MKCAEAIEWGEAILHLAARGMSPPRGHLNRVPELKDHYAGCPACMDHMRAIGTRLISKRRQNDRRNTQKRSPDRMPEVWR